MIEVKRNVFEAIGNTPLIELAHLDGLSPKIKVWAKLEGSIRVARLKTGRPIT